MSPCSLKKKELKTHLINYCSLTLVLCIAKKLYCASCAMERSSSKLTGVAIRSMISNTNSKCSFLLFSKNIVGASKVCNIIFLVNWKKKIL